jgi:hypothetical protein
MRAISCPIERVGDDAVDVKLFREAGSQHHGMHQNAMDARSEVHCRRKRTEGLSELHNPIKSGLLESKRCQYRPRAKLLPPAKVIGGFPS